MRPAILGILLMSACLGGSVHDSDNSAILFNCSTNKQATAHSFSNSATNSEIIGCQFVDNTDFENMWARKTETKDREEGEEWDFNDSNSENKVIL